MRNFAHSRWYSERESRKSRAAAVIAPMALVGVVVTASTTLVGCQCGESAATDKGLVADAGGETGGAETSVEVSVTSFTIHTWKQPPPPPMPVAPAPTGGLAVEPPSEEVRRRSEATNPSQQEIAKAMVAAGLAPEEVGATAAPVVVPRVADAAGKPVLVNPPTGTESFGLPVTEPKAKPAAAGQRPAGQQPAAPKSAVK